MMRTFKITQEQNIKWTLEAHKGATLEERSGLKIIKYEMPNGKPVAIVWRGRQKDPFLNYYYQSVERMEETISEMERLEKGWEEIKKKRLEERKAFRHDYKIGDILYSSWGYDQTNINFFKVTKISEKSIWLREIYQAITEVTGYLTENVKAGTEFKDEKEFSRVVSPGGSVSINDVYNAYKWDGQEMYQSHYH